MVVLNVSSKKMVKDNDIMNESSFAHAPKGPVRWEAGKVDRWDDPDSNESNMFWRSLRWRTYNIIVHCIYEYILELEYCCKLQLRKTTAHMNFIVVAAVSI